MGRMKGHIGSRLRLLRGPADDGAAAPAAQSTEAESTAPTETWDRPGTTVLVVDANATTRAALVHLFRSEWGWNVIGQAADGLSALATAREHSPELVITDAALSDMPLRDLTELLAQAGNPVIVALIDFPHQRVPGVISFVKGAPLQRLKKVAVQSLREERPEPRPSRRPVVLWRRDSDVEPELVPDDCDALPAPSVGATAVRFAAAPPETKPIDVRDGDPAPIEPTPTVATATATLPPESMPIDVRPVDVTPVDATPVDVTPVDATASESGPLQEVPAETLALAATAHADPSAAVRGLALEVLAQAADRAPVESLASFAADPDRQVRSRALQVLVTSRRADCVDPIVERIETESDEELRTAARDGLGRLLSALYAAEDGGATYSVPDWIARRMEGPTGSRVHALQVAGRVGLMTPDLLERALSDPAPAVRTAGIAAVGPLTRDTAAMLISAIGRDTSAEVSLGAVNALGAAQGEEQMRGARLALDHPDRRVRLAGIELLPVEAGGAEALQALLGDEDRMVAEAAASALARFPRAEVVATLWTSLRAAEGSEGDLVLDTLAHLDPDVASRLARRAFDGPSAAERVLGIRAMRAVGIGSCAAELRRALVDPEPEVRAAAVSALADDPHCIPIDDLGGRIRDPASLVRKAVVEALAALDDDRSIGYLLEAARDPAPAVRDRARAILTARSTPALAERLVAALAEPTVRPVAADLLAEMEEVPLDAVLRVILDGDDATREAAVDILRRPDSVERMISDLGETSRHRRETALRGLSLVPNTEALDALIGRLEDPDRELRCLACSALADLADPRAIPAVRWMMASDPDMGVVAAAEESLRRLMTGGPPGDE